jgi:hypothetical protein
VVFLPPGESRERDLSWRDGTGVLDLSADGRQILLMEWDLAGTQTMYLRKTDGSPGVRLGEEFGIALSPDGRWVLALPGILGFADHLVLVPTGAGARRELRDGSIRSLSSDGAAWFPDGRRIAVVGESERHRGRLLVWDVDMSAPPRPLSPEGEFTWPVVSPDGRSVVVSAAGEGVVLYPVDGGLARTLIAGATPDQPLRWSSDGRWLYVRRGSSVPGTGGMPAWIDRVEIATGTRQPWKELKPGDLAGVDGIGSVLVTPDGKSYAYSFGSSIGSLYLVDGPR